MDRASYLYKAYGAEIVGKPAVIRFPSGAKIRTGHLRDDQSYTKYQGHEYQRMVIEELTQIPDEKRYLMLISSCRSTVPGIDARIFTTANPGGNGHQWVRERFIDVAPWGEMYADPDGRTRMFIHAIVDDNPQLQENDPEYVKTLDNLKKVDPELWKAWRLGDWDVAIGQVFKEWKRDIHITDRLEWSLDVCKKFICFDWGYRSPGCAYWLAYTPENKFGVRRVYVYRELYQTEKTPEQWAKDINIFTSIEDVSYMVLPHDCYNKEMGDSIAETFERIIKNPDGSGVAIRKGRTLERDARKNRKAIMHQYLSIADDGKPYLQVTPNNRNFINTLPLLVYADNNPEEINSEGPDHSYDSVSLGLITEPNIVAEGAVLKAKSTQAIKNPLRQDAQGTIKTTDFWKEFKNTKKRNGNPEFTKSK